MLRILRSIIVFAEEVALMDAGARLVKRTAIFLGLGSLILLLVFASAACCTASLWLWADGRFGPVKAPLIVAAALLLVALVLAGIIALTQRSARRTRAERAAQAMQGMAQAPGRLAMMALQGFLAGLATSDKPAPKNRV